MMTIATEIYPDEHQRLERIVSAIQASQLAEAAQLAEDLERRLPDIASPPQKLQVELFLKALRSRLNHTETGNLYLVPDEGQQMRMFNFMAEKFPVVRVSQEIANSLFVSVIPQDATAVTLLDIGIGTGQQMAALIQQIVQQHPQVKKMTLIGIEPSGDSLKKAEAKTKEVASTHGVTLTFVGLERTVEQLMPADWQTLAELRRSSREPFLVNASFALHHVQPIEFRTTLFQRLKALAPTRIVLIEPYADYTTSDLLARFQHAWHHYGLTFRAIDTIEADEAEKSTVKQVFFGREMVDVLSEGERVEQFETGEMWAKHLTEAGFEIQPIEPTNLPAFNAVMTVESHPTYLGFTVNRHPIVAVLCAD